MARADGEASASRRRRAGEAEGPPPRELPSVGRLAEHPLLAAWAGSPSLVDAARQVLAEERTARRCGSSLHPDADALAAAAGRWLERRLRPGPRRVVNATGIVIHTNLGRAPLSEGARRAALAAAGYCDLEHDLGTGGRGSRQEHVAPLLATLCGTEDATVVTNNAAAVLLVLRALCRGREVLVSRGEAVEIGGGFRIPEVMRESGARMVDVGTTNRTRPADYEAAVTPRTAAIVRVHPSNFAVTGFTERPSTAVLADVARRHRLLLIEDAGSGALRPLREVNPELERRAPSPEPVLAECVAAGADVVTSSGDKLCGGPQAGLIAGRADAVARIRRHPLMRALRPDKLVIAALGATLAAHLDGRAGEVPVLRMLARDPSSLEGQARGWLAELRRRGVPAELAAAEGAVGGGALPGATLPTVCVTLPGRPQRLLAALRRADPPVVARADAGRVWLDPRTVSPEEDAELVAAVADAWSSEAAGDGRRR